MTGIDDAMRRMDSLIERVGWAVMHILPTDDDPDTVPFFSHTVGLTAHSYPELLIAGLDPQASQELLNDLARRVYDTAARFTHAQHITDLLDGYEAVIVEGPATDDLRPGAAFARYGQHRVRVQQIVWPDQAGRFPWQPGYTIAPHVQPLLAQA